MFLPSLGRLVSSILTAPMVRGRSEGAQRHLCVFSLFLYLLYPSFEAIVQLGRMVFVKIVSILGYRRYYLEFRAFLGILPQGREKGVVLRGPLNVDFRGPLPKRLLVYVVCGIKLANLGKLSLR